MPEVQVRIDDKQVRQMIDDLRRRAPGYISSAVNKTARADVGQIIKRIHKITSIKPKEIRSGSAGKVWSTKARPPKHSSLIRSRGRPLSITFKRFKARQTRQGVTAIVWGKRRKYPGAFMGPRPGVVAIKLKGAAFRRRRRGRLPIDKLPGPNIVNQRRARTFWKEEEKFLDARLFKELDSQAQRLTRRYR